MALGHRFLCRCPTRNTTSADAWIKAAAINIQGAAPADVDPHRGVSSRMKPNVAGANGISGLADRDDLRNNARHALFLRSTNCHLHRRSRCACLCQESDKARGYAAVASLEWSHVRG